MFNSERKKKALAELEAAIKEYQTVVADVTKRAEELYEKRKATAEQVIQACEEYVNTLANSPKEFDKSVSEEGLANRTIQKIQQKAQEIEQLSGKPFDEVAAALASALGQTVIPVPVLGAVLGTIAGRIAIDLSKKYLGKATERLQRQMDEYYNQCLATIYQTYREVVSKIVAEYEKLGDLTKAAFDTGKNVALRLQASIQLAEAYEVSEIDIIHDINELDAFMLS